MSQLSDCCKATITERVKANGDRENICSSCHHIALTASEKAAIINKKSDTFLNKLLSKLSHANKPV